MGPSQRNQLLVVVVCTCVGCVLGMCAAAGRQKVLCVVGKGDWLLESALPQMMAGPGQLSLLTEATASPLDHRLLSACMESRAQWLGT